MTTSMIHFHFLIVSYRTDILSDRELVGLILGGEWVYFKSVRIVREQELVKREVNMKNSHLTQDCMKKV